MLKFFRKSGSNPLVYATLALLIVGLIGFGGQVGSGVSASSVAAVGDETITTDEFVRAMQNELQRISQQFGQDISVEQARAFGLDGAVMNQLVTAAALDGKARELGVSVGDANVRDNLLRTPAFQGIDGNFAKDAYEYALERLNMTPAEYEISVRDGTARDLLRTGISAGVTMPTTAAATLLAYSGEKRSFDWLTLTASALPEPVAQPTSAQAQAFFDAHNDQFMSPETREIAYLSLTPADMAASVTITDAQIAEAFAARADEFNQPETRAVERLAFASDTDAQAALTRLNAGEVTFEALAAERDLQIADLDLGIVARTALDAEAQDVVFGPADPGIYGPAPTLLGPALFRVNAVFAAQSTSLEQASAQIKQDLALEEAGNLIAEEATKLDDLIAGGATFEEIDTETAFNLGQISWYETLADGIAADPAFQAEAAALIEGEDRDPIGLSDGGVALLHLDAITPPALRPFADVEPQAVAAQKAEAETAKIAEFAAALQSEVTAGKTLAEVAAKHALVLTVAQPVARGGALPQAPDTLIAELFKLAANNSTIIAAPGRADIVQLKEIIAFDPNAEENKALVAEANRQLSEQVGSDLFTVFAAQAQQEAGVAVNAPVLQSLLDSFQ